MLLYTYSISKWETPPSLHSIYAIVSSAECASVFPLEFHWTIGTVGSCETVEVWLADLGPRCVARPNPISSLFSENGLRCWNPSLNWFGIFEVVCQVVKVVFAHISFVHWRVVEGTCQNSSASPHVLRWIFTEALYSYILGRIVSKSSSLTSPKVGTLHIVSPQMFASQTQLRLYPSSFPSYIPLSFRANFESKWRSKGTHFVDSQSYASRHKREWPERTSHIWSTEWIINWVEVGFLGIFGVRSTVITTKTSGWQINPNKSKAPKSIFVLLRGCQSS